MALGAGEGPAVAVGHGPELDARRPELFSGSSQAGVRMASPDTMPGSHACFCSALPERASAPPDRIELTKCGDGAMARPNSS